MKLKGIKSAVRHYNWAAHATVMWDSENDEVWTDVFGGCNDGMNITIKRLGLFWGRMNFGLGEEKQR